jgi:two-component system alkaline phosphatase synthesis response regulator PhoP
MRRLWRDSVQSERVVDVHVCWLRSKIEQDPDRPVHLVTLRGSGYRFDPPARTVNDPITVR